MDAAVDAVDDGIGFALQLVMQAAIDQSPEDRFGRVGLDGEVGERPFGAAPHGAVHGLDDVAARREIAKRLLGAGLHRPDRRGELLGDAEPFERLRAAD